VVIKRT